MLRYPSSPVRVLGVVITTGALVACAASSSPGTEQDQPDAFAGFVDAGELDTGDRQIFAAMLAGEIDPEAGMREIAWSGGWPVATGGGYLFVRLDDGGGPYRLAGDHNGWTPTAMQAGPGFYWTEVPVPAPMTSAYKFVDPAGGYGADRWARHYRYDDFGEISLVRSDGAHIERWPQLEAAGLAPRDVRVWVPAESTERHLYVHDGQNVFDPAAPFGGWKLQEVAGGTRIIAIDNTAERMSEYTPVADEIGGSVVGGAGDAYADLIEKELRPHIEAHYGEPSRVGVMGSSLGGLISLHIVDRYPDRYDFVASLSGTLGWGSFANKSTTVIERYQAQGVRDFTIYIDSGGEDGGGCVDADDDGILDDSGDSDNYCANRQMADTLAGLGYQYDVDLWHWHQPGAEHNEAAWAARVFRPLAIFAGE